MITLSRILPGPVNEEKSQAMSEPEPSKLSSAKPGPAQERDTNGPSKRTENVPEMEIPESSGLTDGPNAQEISQDSTMTDAVISEQVSSLKQRLMERTSDYGVPQLERLYSRVLKGVIAVISGEGHKDHKLLILRHLLKFVEDDDNF